MFEENEMLSEIDGFNALINIDGDLKIHSETRLKLRGFMSLNNIGGKLSLPEDTTLNCSDDKKSALLCELREAS